MAVACGSDLCFRGHQKGDAVLCPLLRAVDSLEDGGLKRPYWRTAGWATGHRQRNHWKGFEVGWLGAPGAPAFSPSTSIKTSARLFSPVLDLG